MRLLADIVNLGDKLKAQQQETARLELTAKMIPIMVMTVEKFTARGHPRPLRLSTKSSAAGYPKGEKSELKRFAQRLLSECFDF